MSKTEFYDFVNSQYEDKINNPGSLRLTDYCYNRYNHGWEGIWLLEYNYKNPKRPLFRLLGEDYPYTGNILPGEPYVCGYWYKGTRKWYSNDDIQEEDAFKANTLQIANEIEDSLDALSLTGEERIAATKIRVNQSEYRKGLLRRYDRCCLCGVGNKDLLIASHIKPWSQANLEEKLDFDNGLLLCPNHDKLFDLGYITFDNSGNIMISPLLSKKDREFTNVNEKMKIEVNEKNCEYLEYHRTQIYKK